MQTRRHWFRILTSTAVAGALMVGSVWAAELFGTIKEVDVEAKKIVVTPKDGGDDVTVTVKTDTEIVSAKGKAYTLEKLKKGANVQVIHEEKIASKIIVSKGAAKKQDAPPQP